jgi:hypothetical protein
MIRWRIEIDTEFSVPVKVEISDSEYSGSVINVVGSDNAVITQSGVPDSDTYRKIQSSEITLTLAGLAGDYDDLFIRDFGRFKATHYVDGDVRGEYLLMPDTFSTPDLENPAFGNFFVTIRGTCISAFKKVKVSEILDLDGDRISKLD